MGPFSESPGGEKRKKQQNKATDPNSTLCFIYPSVEGTSKGKENSPDLMCLPVHCCIIQKCSEKVQGSLSPLLNSQRIIEHLQGSKMIIESNSQHYRNPNHLIKNFFSELLI